eukprot:2714588-Rhodomonas_salina.1
MSSGRIRGQSHSCRVPAVTWERVDSMTMKFAKTAYYYCRSDGDGRTRVDIRKNAVDNSTISITTSNSSTNSNTISISSVCHQTQSHWHKFVETPRLGPAVSLRRVASCRRRRNSEGTLPTLYQTPTSLLECYE